MQVVATERAALPAGRQIARHDIWDYDLPAAPNLIDVTVDGRRIKSVAQVTKQGSVFALDRVTGAPLWPIEDRPVQGVRDDDLIDLTPELRQGARAIIAATTTGRSTRRRVSAAPS